MRREQCAQAARHLGVASLHVVSEITRVEHLVDTLGSEDAHAVAANMLEGHASPVHGGVSE